MVVPQGVDEAGDVPRGAEVIGGGLEALVASEALHLGEVAAVQVGHARHLGDAGGPTRMAATPAKAAALVKSLHGAAERAGRHRIARRRRVSRRDRHPLRVRVDVEELDERVPDTGMHWDCPAVPLGRFRHDADEAEDLATRAEHPVDRHLGDLADPHPVEEAHREDEIVARGHRALKRDRLEELVTVLGPQDDRRSLHDPRL